MCNCAAVYLIHCLSLSFKGGNCIIMCSSFAVSRHRRAIQKSRGSKVRRAEGTMESEPDATAATANTTGTLVSMTTTTTTTTSSSSSSSTTTSSSTTASGVSTTSHMTTTAPTTSTSTSSSSSSSGGSSTNTSSTSSSTTTTATTTSTGRLAVPQISVYSGMPDRQAVQVSSLTMWRSANLLSHPHHMEGSPLWLDKEFEFSWSSNHMSYTCAGVPAGITQTA